MMGQCPSRSHSSKVSAANSGISSSRKCLNNKYCVLLLRVSATVQALSVFSRYSLVPFNNVNIDIYIYATIASNRHRPWARLRILTISSTSGSQKVDTEDVSQQSGHYYRRKLHSCPRRTSRYVHDLFEWLHFIMTEACYLKPRHRCSERSRSAWCIS